MAVRFLIIIPPKAGTIRPALKQALGRNAWVNLLGNFTDHIGVEGIVLIEAPSSAAAELFTKDFGNKIGDTIQMFRLFS